MDVQTAPQHDNQTRPPLAGPPLGSQPPPPRALPTNGNVPNGNQAPPPTGFMGGIRPPPPGAPGFRPPLAPAGAHPPSQQQQQQQGIAPMQVSKMPGYPNGNTSNGPVPMQTTSTAHPPTAEAPAAPAAPGPVSNGNIVGNDAEPATKAAPESSDPAPVSPHSGVSPEDIQTVQNLVERCLQLYMARDEVVTVLKSQATIDPGFTQLVWSKLEEQNPEFFKCYYTRLKLKAQIVMFNHLLEQQVAVVQRMQQGWNGGAGAGGPSSSTTSGIPLFQSGANGRDRKSVV